MARFTLELDAEAEEIRLLVASCFRLSGLLKKTTSVVIPRSEATKNLSFCCLFSKGVSLAALGVKVEIVLQHPVDAPGPVVALPSCSW